MTNKHLIGKLTIRIEISSSENAYALQQQWSNMVWKDLAPKLEKLFNGMTDANEMIRLDKVEIDIGQMSFRSGDETKIAEEIIRHLSGLIKVQGNFAGLAASRNITGPEPAKEGRLTGPVEKKLLRKHYFDLWLYWLQRGTLPSYTVPPEENWMGSVLETLAMDHNAVTQLRIILKKHPLALQRLVLQHNPEDLKSVVELYTGHSHAKLSDLFEELRTILYHPGTGIGTGFRVLETEIWTFVFEKVILERKKLDSAGLRHEIISSLLLHTLGKEWKKKYLKSLDTTYPFLQELFAETVSLRPGTDTGETPVEALTDPFEERDTNVPELEDDPDADSPRFFENAGVVLLHPFLSRLFEKLDLIKGKEFTTPECRNKAVLLLHFLATANEKVPEYEMVLPKFLCTMPANLPLDHTVILKKKEKKEAALVLQAAIDHWGALGTTSPDGLREGFLMREGKLEKEQSGWKLYVEHKAQDILLDRLPWNLSVIRLPWMREILKVEWR